MNRYTENERAMPGAGDPETWGAIWHPNDPRQQEPEDAEGDDGTLDLLAELRGWIHDAERAHELGNDEKALHCLCELIETALQFTEGTRT